MYRKNVVSPQRIIVFFWPAFAVFVPEMGVVYFLNQPRLSPVQLCEIQRFRQFKFNHMLRNFPFYKEQMRTVINGFKNRLFGT